MSGDVQEANTGLRARGAAYGYIVIQPNATPAPPLANWDEDDDNDVYDFMMQAVARYAVDRRRIHVTGFSQGAAMAWRFVCDHSDVIASAAPIAASYHCNGSGLPGTDGCSFENGESPDIAIPVLYAHGVMDKVLPYECTGPLVNNIGAAYNLNPTPVNIEVGSRFQRARWHSFDNNPGAVLEHILHAYIVDTDFIFDIDLYGGHCFPGSTDPGEPFVRTSWACEGPREFVWGEEVMEFFLNHPRP